MQKDKKWIVDGKIQKAHKEVTALAFEEHILEELFLTLFTYPQWYDTLFLRP